MTEAQAVEVLTQRWLDAWPALQPLVPYQFENESVSYTNADSFVRVSFVPTTRVQSTMGSEGARKFEVRGQIFAQLFGALDRGIAPLYELADAVRRVYEARRIGDEIVTYGGASRTSPGEGRWHMMVVVVPFMFDETR